MKTRLLLTFLCLCTCLMGAEAQTIQNTSILKGERKAVGKVLYGWADIDGYDTNYSFGMEISRGSYVANNVYFLCGIGWDSWSLQYKFSSWDYSTTSRFDLNLPLLIGYSFPLGNKMALDIDTGPRVNYLFSGKIKSYYYGETETKKYKDIEGLKRFNFNWNFGIALDLGKIGISFQYRYAFKEGEADTFRIGLLL